MGLSREELIELASRYLSPTEIIDFPHDGEVFCLLFRDIPNDRVLEEEEGWGFGGYGLCIGYLPDEEAKPSGKWLWMHFASLDKFPPNPQVIKLQPPHVARGKFQNPERNREIKIMKIGISNVLKSSEKEISKKAKEAGVKGDTGEKIVQFRKKR